MKWNCSNQLGCMATLDTSLILSQTNLLQHLWKEGNIWNMYWYLCKFCGLGMLKKTNRDERFIKEEEGCLEEGGTQG